MLKENNAPLYDDSFKRLSKLQGTDPGLFVLAVHSFIEGVLRPSCPLSDPSDDSFGSYLGEFRSRLISKATGYVPGLDVLGLIRQQHQLTNEVRHRFATASVEDARAATQHLRRFCQLAGIPEGEGLRSALEYLKAWEERRSYGDLVKDMNELGYRYQLEKKSAREMAERVAALEIAQAEAAHFREQIAVKDRALAELEAAKEKKDERVDRLRAERAALAAELKKAKEKAAAYDDAQAYIDQLSRMTVLTRTRADYERSIIRLTSEQKKVLEQIKLDSDFLVKGAAGTGKTLVLLKAIEKAKAGGATEQIGFAGFGGSVALLTFSHTLAMYDRYIATILSPDTSADKITTADAFIQERLAAIDPGARMDYEIVKGLSERYKPEGFGAKELADEAEAIIWGNDLSYEAYVESGFERRGMKKALQKADRAKLWAAAEAMAAEMEAAKRYVKEYSRIKLLRAAEASPKDGRITCMDYIFVDEAQDLSAASLKAIKACARTCVVLAGDADQSIYQPGFTFKQAGLDIVGRSKILHTNFRNTIAVHDLAESYRALQPGLDAETQPEAFREGPPPELFTEKGKDRDGLVDLLVARASLFLGHLGYDPENICVLAPQGADVDLVCERLVAAGIGAADLRSRDFAFESEGRVRVSTFQSAKGLDFPVVFLFLYRPPYAGSGYDEATLDRITRNLIYVGATRAMDHLDVFTYEAPSSAAIRDFVACMEAGENRAK